MLQLQTQFATPKTQTSSTVPLKAPVAPMPLTNEQLQQVVGGAASTCAPGRGW